MDYEYIKRFEKLGFGLFIHFGLYSILGKGEWYLKNNPNADKELYSHLPERFLVKHDWAKTLVATAKKAGCKYITLTTRHHDGFSLYDTKGLNEFDAPHSASKRDLISEFVEECNRAGIVPFFYHTLLDWHEKSYYEDFSAYVDYLIKSVEILCENYGKIGGFWFDGYWDKPDVDWQFDRLYSTIRKYQPEAMIINNTGLNALGQVSHKEIDSVTFERGKPTFVDCSDKPRAGEMCEGITDHWGYTENDFCFKPYCTLLNTLIDCRANNCNLLLNTGLKGDGRMTVMEKELLTLLGKWIKKNKNFIYSVKKADTEATGATILSDGEYYYAVIKDVWMAANANVARVSEDKFVTILSDKKVKNAKWLDNGESVEVKNNRFEVKPFCYGESAYARVVRFKLK